LFRDQALTVAIALMISLVVSLTLIPMLASLKGQAKLHFPSEPDDGSKARERVWRFGVGVLAWPLRNPRRGRAVAIGLFVVTLPLKALFLAGWLLVLLLSTLLPMLMFALAWLGATIGRAFGRAGGSTLGTGGNWLMRGYDAAANGYRRLLPRVLSQPAPVLVLAAMAFAGALALAGTLGLDLIPQFAQDRFEVTAKLAPGTQLADTDSLVRTIQRRHAGDEGVRAIYGVSGTGTRLDASPTESGENIARLTVVMDRGVGAAGEAAQTERMAWNPRSGGRSCSASPRRWKSNCAGPTSRPSSRPVARWRRCCSAPIGLPT
jgi:HAE1 family hydrophobic/amphiphilic exporter-1